MDLKKMQQLRHNAHEPSIEYFVISFMIAEKLGTIKNCDEWFIKSCGILLNDEIGCTKYPDFYFKATRNLYKAYLILSGVL